MNLQDNISLTKKTNFSPHFFCFSLEAFERKTNPIWPGLTYTRILKMHDVNFSAQKKIEDLIAIIYNEVLGVNFYSLVKKS